MSNVGRAQRRSIVLNPLLAGQMLDAELRFELLFVERQRRELRALAFGERPTSS